ncbi:non-specific lipid transfer protein GPI-anchored 11-like [Phoenix dactylifera]|uniref:Non-specific lipid transfer protein GPI-anchored 11-like n=1 Tax=Phoenix dactylifera TaxID=42345 RepID=A0A8B7CYQ7_PHODC|nr:non-specific lipid transfer protein GPI-anchored 11-like [Phoenix dactylifera]
MARLMWVLSLLATLALSAAASSSPPPSSVNCDSVVMDMMDCISYVSMGSKQSRPDEECCRGVSSVVNTSPTCLCAALQEAMNMGVDLDMKRAAALPAACSIKVSVGDCGV